MVPRAVQGSAAAAQGVPVVELKAEINGLRELKRIQEESKNRGQCQDRIRFR